MRIVIKIGTSSICDENTFVPKLSNLSLLVETVVDLQKQGHLPILVTSGAVGMGLLQLNLSKRPKHISQVQAVAAVGQGRLMALYDNLFSNFNVSIAQILITRDNLAERHQYLNALNTLEELLSMNVVPIINENDSVTSSEIRFGDNDSLSAIAAGMIQADYLFLLTDVDAVCYTLSGSRLGTGGMVTKLIAAEIATCAGCHVVISIGSDPKRILGIIDSFEKEKIVQQGTIFVGKEKPTTDRKWWMHGLATYGELEIDNGAAAAIKNNQSLFAAGIVRITGTFNAQQCVILKCKDEIGRGLVNYSSQDISKIIGKSSTEIAQILGFRETEHVIHRDNIVLKR